MTQFDCGREKEVKGLQGAMIQAIKLQRSSDKGSSAVSLEIMAIGHLFQDKGTIGKVWQEGDAGEAPSARFESACKDTEDYIKSKDAGRNQVDKLPKYWIQPKSNVKAAINLGLDITLYKSESALRKAKIKAMAALRGENYIGDGLKDIKKALEVLPKEVAVGLMTEMVAAAKQRMLDGVLPNTDAEPANEMVNEIAALEQHIGAVIPAQAH